MGIGNVGSQLNRTYEAIRSTQNKIQPKVNEIQASPVAPEGPKKLPDTSGKNQVPSVDLNKIKEQMKAQRVDLPTASTEKIESPKAEPDKDVDDRIKNKIQSGYQQTAIKNGPNTGSVIDISS